MKFFTFLLTFNIFLMNAQQFLTPYEKGNGNQTTTYQEMVDFYNQLDVQFETIKVVEKGTDDNGEPLRVVIYSPNTNFDLTQKNDRGILFINNGIHPGEPDGIDATMMMMRDFAIGKRKAPKNIIIAAIEAYNISGMLNRGCCSRANQNGPEQYGFRGNARNYDLNRDFIKTDSKNARGFQEIFHWINPDYFIDNHVSNGADYQYLFTYISTNKELLGNPLGDFLHKEMQPTILKTLNQKGILTVPYVNIHGDSPDEGFPAFMDTPRYATGYTTLFNVPGTVAETHMLKPYAQRVNATLEYMLASIDYLSKNYQKIRMLMQENRNTLKPGNLHPIQWTLDRNKFSMIPFHGYEAGKKPSAVSGQPRLFYDRTKPFVRDVKFFDTYSPTKSVVIPTYYVIPQSEWRLLEELRRNKISMKPLAEDSLLTVESYKIKDFQTVKNPYEGHYLHSGTSVEKATEKLMFRKGDFLVPLAQEGTKFLLETLEPEAVDSYFNWNFMDGILGQKEYYSAYIFEDTAAELLKKDPGLKADFEKKKTEDAKFAEDGSAQIDWIYTHSPYFEGNTYRQYPVYRIL